VEFQYFVRTTGEHSWLKWVTVKQSLLLKGGVNDGKMMGLFADRRFKKKDIIGIYLGKYKEETEKEFGYQFGNIDAKRGLDGKPFMGMHFMNDPNLKDNQMKFIPNAVGWDDCEMQATTSIIEEDELLLDYKGRTFMNQLRKKAAMKAVTKAVTKAPKKAVTKAAKNVATKVSKKAPKKAVTKVSKKVVKKAPKKAVTKAPKKAPKKVATKAVTKAAKKGKAGM